MTIRFSGEGKWRGEWGVKREESAVPFPGEEGSTGRRQRMQEVAAAAAPGRLPEEEESRATDRAGPPLSEGEVAGLAGQEGRGREVGRCWTKR
jgi:hypothetical protein